MKDKHFLEDILLFFKKSTTAKSGVWYLVSDMLLKGMAFITVPIFTRLLSVEEFGIVAVYSSFVGIMAILTGLDLHAGIGRAAIDFEEDYPKYLSSVLSLSLVFFLIGLLLMSAFSNSLSTFVDLTPDLLLIATVAGYGSFVFNFYNSHLLFQRKYKQKSLLHIVRAISEVVLAIIMILLIREAKYYGRVYSSLTMSIAFMAICFIKIFRKSNKIFFLGAWRYAIKIGIPLVPHNLSGIILAQFDRMAIQALVGATETGLYSFAYNVGMIPLVFLGATNAAWRPWFYRQLQINRKDKIKKAVKMYSLTFLVITLGIMILGPELALMMAPGDYLSGVKLVPVVVLSYFFQFLYTIYVNFAFYMKKSLAISIGTIMAGGLNIALNLLMIPVFGYEIAAWTTVISYFCLFIFHWFNVSILLKEKTIGLRAMMGLAVIASVIALQQYITSVFFPPFSIIERLLRFGISGLACLVLIAYILNTARTMMNSNRNSEGKKVV
ncbi:MAG TPA: oligosaccharide flippase family protein [Saccharofermentans sp.]|nr:oligosaccharide flippase family protein [Saccharofermentans sp.]